MFTTEFLQLAGFNDYEIQKYNQHRQLKKAGRKIDKVTRQVHLKVNERAKTYEKQLAKAPKVTKFEDKKHVRWTQEMLNAFDKILAPVLGVGETTDQQIFWQEYLRHLHTYRPVLAMFECRIRKNFDRYVFNEVQPMGEAVGGRLVEFDHYEFCEMIHEAVLGEGCNNPDDVFYTKLQARVVRGEQIAELRAIFRRDLDKMAALWTSLK